MLNNLIDCHTHSKNSPDAIDSVDAMCEQAIKLGLSAYAITDHVECCLDRWKFEHDDEKIKPLYFKDIFEGSMSEISTAKEKYKGKLNLLCGLELGEPYQDLENADFYINDKRLDFVIASIHQIRKHEDFYFLDYNNYDIQKLMTQYFEEIFEMCQWGKFDVVGHLTYTLRYMEGEQGHMVDMKPYQEIIRECFKVLAHKGKGIEINTSGLRQKFGDSFPSLEYVKMFKECGGEILTVGSDSHCVADLGKGISQAYEIAKNAGFRYVTYFKDRKPNFIKL